MASQFLSDHPDHLKHHDTRQADNRKERRRVQNRLNQRASRRRKAVENPRSSARKWMVYVDQSHLAQRPVASEENTVHFCRLGLDARQNILRKLKDHINQAVSTHTLSSELLLPVTQWNIIRAMSTNATTMGLTMALLAEDIISPFNTSGPTTTNLPPSLQPTNLQKTIIHHPWIDLCPVSSIRDALLRNLDLYSEDELCHDLFGSSGGCSQPTGLLVWGEEWDPFAYEISEGILRKWGWLWSGCTAALQSTNYWRLQRGEDIFDYRLEVSQ